MRVITAIENDFGTETDVKCFLAGGITNCPQWQNDVIDRLYQMEDWLNLDNLVIFNPRRENFPIDDPNASTEQITWEFNNLQKMDIFSMFFCAGDSDQPICMYELGRNLLSMFVKFPVDWTNRIVISCDSNYRRAQDVKIQTDLAVKAVFDLDPLYFSGNPYPDLVFMEDRYKVLIENHAVQIARAYQELMEKRQDQLFRENLRAEVEAIRNDLSEEE